MLRNLLSLLLFITLLGSTSTAYATVSEKTIIHSDDKKAQFPGGTEKMNAWIKENLRFPKENVRYGIVRVEFTVKKNGKCTGFTVTKGINEDMNFSAVECLQGMPVWEPAVKEGKKVNSVVVIPVKFSAEDNK